MKYRCLGCEDPCVVEIAMKADRMPTQCLWGDHERPQWEEWKDADRCQSFAEECLKAVKEEDGSDEN